MIKRTMIPALLGLALASHAVLAQDMVSPAKPGPERTTYQPLSDEQVRQEITAQHVLIRPARGEMRLFVPRALLSCRVSLHARL